MHLHGIGALCDNGRLHISRARVGKHSITLAPHVHIFSLTLTSCPFDQRNLQWTQACFDGVCAKV